MNHHNHHLWIIQIVTHMIQMKKQKEILFMAMNLISKLRSKILMKPQCKVIIKYLKWCFLTVKKSN